VLVARTSDLGARDLPAAPVLAVEVLSPSTRRLDMTLKRSRYEAADCPSYWVVDPDAPSLRAWDLVDGAYVQVGEVAGSQIWTSTRPYAVQLRPADLGR
jgi:Uma2 family endonuclease